MNLTGKNGVYLGGFGGIGQTCVAELLTRQLKALAIFDLRPNEELLSAWQVSYPKTDIFYQKMDITKKSDIETAFKETAKRIGHFDVVINGCGILDDRLVELTIQINLLGLIQSSLIALDYMDKAKGGQGGLILNISSVAGLTHVPSMAVYSAAKNGVTAFTRALANPFYYEHSGVGFITICPGFTRTSMLDSMVDKCTFSYDTPIKALIPKAKRQSAEICASNLVKVIEQGKNDDVWMLEYGEMKTVDMRDPLWKAEFED